MGGGGGGITTSKLLGHEWVVGWGDGVGGTQRMELILV